MSNKHGAKWIRPARRLAIYLRDGFMCLHCEKTVDEKALSLDHVKPRSRGGSNVTKNLITACHDCNSNRKSKALSELAPEVQRRIRAAVRRRVDIIEGKRLLANRRAVQHPYKYETCP